MIAIILINWNGHRDTIECLESLLRMKDGNYIVFIVDNGSSDGSLEKIKAWADAPIAPKPHGAPWSRLQDFRVRVPKLHVVSHGAVLDALGPGDIVFVQNPDNLGFAGANNIGMRMARSVKEITHFWLLNNDTVVDGDCIAALRKVGLDKPECLIGACLMYYHNPDMVQGVAGFFKPWLARGGHIGFGLRYDQLPPLAEIEAAMKYVMGASIFLPVSVYDAIGPMSEDYFLYYEEMDWASKMPLGHMTVALNALVFHKEGGSIGSNSLARPSDTSIYYLNVNLIRFMRRHLIWWSPLSIMRALRSAVGFLVKGDYVAVRLHLRAIYDALSGRYLKGPIS